MFGLFKRHRYRVVLLDVGRDIVGVLKITMRVRSCGLKEAVDVVKACRDHGCPVEITAPLKKKDADAITKDYLDVGAFARTTEI